VKNAVGTPKHKYGSKALIKELDLVIQPTLAADRESFDNYQLEKDIYIIIPIFGRWAGVKGKFLLRVFTDSLSEMKELTPGI
jgi:hypothetical protein